MNPPSLILVPTPISDELPLESVALKQLQENCLKDNVGILIEEHKVGRQRWLKWGLPRAAIEKFILYNEHTQNELIPSLISQMKQGRVFYLLSDAGLPAFCDPGQLLVSSCHESGLRVSSTPFPNSIALALALSGLPHQEFHFGGFLPANEAERKASLERLSKISQTLILMDTPYRMQVLLKDLAASSFKKRLIFVALDLNQESEQLYRGHLTEMAAKLSEVGKREFVMVLGAG